MAVKPGTLAPISFNSVRLQIDKVKAAAEQHYGSPFAIFNPLEAMQEREAVIKTSSKTLFVKVDIGTDCIVLRIHVDKSNCEPSLQGLLVGVAKDARVKAFEPGVMVDDPPAVGATSPMDPMDPKLVEIINTAGLKARAERMYNGIPPNLMAKVVPFEQFLIVEALQQVVAGMLYFVKMSLGSYADSPAAYAVLRIYVDFTGTPKLEAVTAVDASSAVAPFDVGTLPELKTVPVTAEAPFLPFAHPVSARSFTPFHYAKEATSSHA